MTMLARSVALTVLALTASGLSAAAQTTAQEPAPAAPQARFALVPVDGGALKIDTRTGKVSRCAKDATGFTCTAVPDTRDAYEAEIARLQAEIAALKQGAPAQGGAPKANPPQAGAEPSDLDKAFDYATHFYRRLRQMIDELTGPDKGETL